MRTDSGYNDFQVVKNEGDMYTSEKLRREYSRESERKRERKKGEREKGREDKKKKKLYTK